MYLDLEKYVTEENFIYLLELFSDIDRGISILGVNGEIPKVNCRAIIKDNKLRSHCNVFKARHLFSDEFNIENNKLHGKFNVIHLQNIKNGKFSFQVKNEDHFKDVNLSKTEDIKKSEDMIKLHNINKIFTHLYKIKDNILHVENIDSKEDIIINLDYDGKNTNVIYFKNVKTKKNIIINYSSNNITLIFDGVNQNVIINNDYKIENLCNESYSILSSDKFEREKQNIEKFGNSKSKSGFFEMVTIFFIIYLFYYMLTGKEKIIKLNL